MNLLKPKPVFRVGKIIKVKNRSAGLAHDYTWLLLIMDGKNDIAARAVIQASGLFGGAMASESPNFPEFPKERSMRLKKKKSSVEILDLLSETLQQQVSQSDVKHLLREKKDFIPNTIDDEILILKKLKKK